MVFGLFILLNRLKISQTTLFWSNSQILCMDIHNIFDQLFWLHYSNFLIAFIFFWFFHCVVHRPPERLPLWNPWNTIAKIAAQTLTLFSKPYYCYFLTSYPVSFSQSHNCLFTLLPYSLSQENSGPDSHGRALKPPPQAPMLLGREAKLKTHNGCSEHPTFTATGWSAAQVLRSSDGGTQWMQQSSPTHVSKACSNLHRQTDKNLQVHLVKPQPSTSEVLLQIQARACFNITTI